MLIIRCIIQVKNQQWKTALPKTVCPQGGTVLKAFTFDPLLNLAATCGQEQERLPQSPLQIFYISKHKYQQLFFVLFLYMYI